MTQAGGILHGHTQPADSGIWYLAWSRIGNYQVTTSTVYDNAIDVSASGIACYTTRWTQGRGAAFRTRLVKHDLIFAKELSRQQQLLMMVIAFATYS